jgi:polysaccharide export outer membrane protein
MRASVGFLRWDGRSGESDGSDARFRSDRPCRRLVGTLITNMRRLTAIFLAVTFLTACMRNRLPQAPTVATDDPAFSAPERIVMPGLASDPPEALSLMPGDVVQLTAVSAETQVYEGLIVDAKGLLHVPLAGDVQVGGMALTDAERAIERELRRYDRFVRVNLVITILDGHTAVVVGQATNPGRYPATPGMRLADLLALAGGVKIAQAINTGVPFRLGNLELARLVRDGESVPVSLLLARQGDPKHNVRIHAGDTLYIPPVTDQLITVLGEVRNPQPMPYREGLRLSEALARAGGVNNQRGDRKDIRVIRGPLREPRVYTTNLKDFAAGRATDVQLVPGDIIYVSRAWYASTADVLGALSPVLSLANSVAIFAIADAISRGN